MLNDRLSGILAHPTMFPSPYGIGDLGSAAYDFIDFLESANQTLWQILPLNPTSFGDSPYQSFSTFAGNPLLISPELLVKDQLLAHHDLWGAPDSQKINYGAVIAYKERILRLAYNNFHINKEQRPAFLRFCNKNAAWLNDYCLFMALKAHFIKERENDTGSAEYLAFKSSVAAILGENQINDYYYGAVWQSWPLYLAVRDKTAVEKWAERLAEEIEYLSFKQFLFFKQWENLKSYANEKGIKIIGDVPIFVSLDSADVWSAPDLFCLDKKGYPTAVAGVPPDYFSETGQLWGNPLYDWAKHEANDFAWWAARIKSALKFADIVRIDHFRGFESYWAVPATEKTAIKGKWLKGPGRALFDKLRLRLGELPIIAEDLGLITPKVEQLRDSLNLPGMRVMQFGFDGTHKNVHCPHNYPQNSVAYTGTHDNDTTRGWYEASDEKTKDLFRRYLNADGSDPAWQMIRALMLSAANWAVIPVQDVLSLGSQARMNFPGIPGGNWQYRFASHSLNGEAAQRLKYLSELSDRNQKPEPEITTEDDPLNGKR